MPTRPGSRSWKLSATSWVIGCTVEEPEIVSVPLTAPPLPLALAESVSLFAAGRAPRSRRRDYRRCPSHFETLPLRVPRPPPCRGLPIGANARQGRWRRPGDKVNVG